MEIDALIAVLKPLISSIFPNHIREPKSKIAILIRKMLEEELGDAMYTSFIDDFIIDLAEKDPARSLAKLIILHDKIGNVIHEIVKGEE